MATGLCLHILQMCENTFLHDAGYMGLLLGNPEYKLILNNFENEESLQFNIMFV